MKLISWNVNGIRAIHNKGFDESFSEMDADIFCIQETKVQEGQFDLEKDGYFLYMNCAQKKGYSGTAIWTKIEPLSVSYGMGIEEHDKEGRIITLEFSDFYLINIYTPNSQRGLERLEYRVLWEEDFRKFVKELDDKKPVIICGDLNVAHKEIDLKNPDTNHKSAGFTDEERAEFTKLLELGFIDTFRHLYPEEIKYSWWSYITRARDRNVGWRIDYFVISEKLKEKLSDSFILNEYYGSDHCPVGIEIDFS
ncbi:MAG: exodeoxyribonuclease III [Methanosarcinaceae archaeon]|nr:exodeoxyribonuclease III [Methanosarcinaceae archaeon]